MKAILHHGSHGGPRRAVETTATVGSDDQTILVDTPTGKCAVRMLADGQDVILYHGELVAVSFVIEPEQQKPKRDGMGVGAGLATLGAAFVWALSTMDNSGK